MLIAKSQFLAVLCIIVFAFCLLPLANYCYAIATIGGNNISNDYLLFLPTLDKILSGTYNWSHFITDTVYMGHWSSASVLVHLFVALVSRWNARFELYLGVFFAVLRLALLSSMLSESLSGKEKLMLTGGLAALVFSMSQAANFLYGQNAIAVNLCLLGFTFGLWSLAKLKKQWYALLFMAVGGLISSASFGNVLPCWLGLLIALPIFGYRHWQHYLAWLAAFVLGMYPYINYLLWSNRSSLSTVHSTLVHKCFFLVNVLGRPFCNGIGFDCGRMPMAEFSGLLGLMIATITVYAICRKRMHDTRTKASFVILVYGLLGVGVVSMVRTLAIPVYTFLAINFWIGIFGLSFSLIHEAIIEKKSVPGSRLGIFGLTNILVIGILYILTNRTYADKSAFPLARTPASEAVIRNYRTAPTYGEECVFQLGCGNLPYLIYISEPLERLGLSAFSPCQQWSLQGDYLLHNVSVRTPDRNSMPTWIWSTDPKKKESWKSFRHLNLCVAPNSTIQWDFDLPKNLKSAYFSTKVRAGSSSALPTPEDICHFGINTEAFSMEHSKVARSENNSNQNVTLLPNKWVPIFADLSNFKRKHVSLVLKFISSDTAHTAIWEYPHVDITLDSAGNKNRLPVLLKPSNTDISPYFPKSISRTFNLPNIASPDWVSGRILFSPNLKEHNPYESVKPTITFQPKVDIDLQDYSHLFAEMSAPERMYPRAISVEFMLRNGSIKRLNIPLLTDGAIHRYTYDLRLLELNKRSLVKQITVCPVTKNAKDTVALMKLSLIVAD